MVAWIFATARWCGKMVCRAVRLGARGRTYSSCAFVRLFLGLKQRKERCAIHYYINDNLTKKKQKRKDAFRFLGALRL